MKFLLDTNVVSETMRPAPNRRLLARLAQHEGQFAISAVTWQELTYGVCRLPESAKKSALEAHLSDVRALLPEMLPFTAEAAGWLGAEMARLERAGVTVACEDGQIAAIARTGELTLVTANTKHFTRFEELRVVDWMR